MSGVVNESVKCGTCGYLFHDADLDQESGKHKPCPKCGSLKRIIDVAVEDKLTLHDYLAVEIKRPLSKHKKHRADYESGQGIIRGKNGKLVYKKKVRDREHPDSPGSYVEYVRDKDGNIIVNKSEKLSEHGKA